MQGPEGKVQGPLGFATVLEAARKPWSASITRQQRATITNPGMQRPLFAESEPEASSFVSAATSASMLLKNRSVKRLLNTSIASAHALSSVPSSLCESSNHLLLGNPKHRSAFMLTPCR